MNYIKSMMRTVFSSTIAVFCLIGSLAFQANAVTCGDSIVSNTTLTAADVVTSCAGPGLTVNASNITLDCAGFSVSGSGTDVGILLDSVSGVTVVNCSVLDFAVGIQVLPGANQNTILRNRVVGSTSTGNGAIEVRSNGNIVQDNNASSNTGRGFAVINGTGNYLQRNTASLNGFRGFDIIDSSFNFLFANRATDNFSGGYVISGAASNNIIYKNAAENSGSEGFALLSGGNFLNSNRAFKNTTFGFNDSTGPANVYTNNKCNFNGTAGSSTGTLCTPQVP